jgi:methionyl-tRNA synthetase
VVANLFNRVLTFTYSKFDKKVPEFKPKKSTGYDQEILDLIRTTIRKTKGLYENFKVRDLTRQILQLARQGNLYFQENEPWKMIKSDPERVQTILNVCIRLIEALSILYYPVIPDSSLKMWEALNLPYPLTDLELKSLEDIGDPAGRELKKPAPLFKKIEDEQIQKHLKALEERLAPSLNSEVNKETEEENLITFHDFQKLDLRTGTVTSAEKVKKSNKLIRMKVKVGNQEKQIIGGLAPHYSPENLIGKTVVVVNNLKPATLMGELSEGMLLAAKENDKLKLLTIEGEITDGAKIS